MDPLLSVPDISTSMSQLIYRLTDIKVFKLSVRIILIIILCTVYMQIGLIKDIADRQPVIVRFIMKALCLVLYINTSILSTLIGIQIIFIYFNSNINYRQLFVSYFQKQQNVQPQPGLSQEIRVLKEQTLLLSRSKLDDATDFNELSFDGEVVRLDID